MAAATLSSTALAGCGIFDNGPDRPSAPDPLQPVLDEAVTLAAAYDRATVALPTLATRLTPLGADHHAHIAELSRVIGQAVPSAGASGAAGSSAPAADPKAALAELRKAEQAAQRTAVAACRTAPAARAALVGSIAACRATHAEALR